MSSGHHCKVLHHPDIIAEVERLLDDPKVAAYIERGQWHGSVDYGKKIPLTGGSSKDGLTYYVDRDLPQKFRATVLWHERVEKALRAVKGMSYDRAHKLATTAERMMVEESGRDWAAYKKEIAGYVRQNETPQKMPPAFDTGPYRESGSMDLLA